MKDSSLILHALFTDIEERKKIIDICYLFTFDSVSSQISSVIHLPASNLH